MRRLAFLITGGAVFLFLWALPVFADGGPHDTAVNSGSMGVNKDSCAGCHRTHTAPAEMLLVKADSDLCLTCHGSTGSGATTDVMDGVQFKVGYSKSEGAVLGALRSGGFGLARIGSGQAGRLSYRVVRGGAAAVSQDAFVPVLNSGQAVTSRHLNPESPSLGTVWGNGTTGAGLQMTLECTSCHNPHGNGQYRVLIPIPGDGTGGMAEATAKAYVDDAPARSPLPADATKNYTVIQKYFAPTTAAANYWIYASDVADWSSWSSTAGDYFHRKVPWNGISSSGQSTLPDVPSMRDAPNGLPSTFDTQINAWCAQCHSRYLTTNTTYPAGHGPYDTSSGDSIFTYRHSNSSDKPCTTCHVAHGSNAQMSGFASLETQPGSTDTTWGTNSLLLKLDNRGTCQACHDPTDPDPTAADGRYVPAAQPTPLVP